MVPVTSPRLVIIMVRSITISSVTFFSFLNRSPCFWGSLPLTGCWCPRAPRGIRRTIVTPCIMANCRRPGRPSRTSRLLIALTHPSQWLSSSGVALSLLGDILIHAFTFPATALLEVLCEKLRHLRQLWQPETGSQVREEFPHSSIVGNPVRFLPNYEPFGRACELRHQAGGAKVALPHGHCLLPLESTFLILLEWTRITIPDRYAFTGSFDPLWALRHLLPQAAPSSLGLSCPESNHLRNGGSATVLVVECSSSKGAPEWGTMAW